jgi:hypothetical protein
MENILSGIKDLDVSGLLANAGVQTGTHQLFLFLVLLFVLLYGMSIGKTRVLVSLLSIYVAFMIATLFPFLDALSGISKFPMDDSLARVFVFFAAFITSFLVLDGSSLRHRMIISEMAFWHVLPISMIQIGFMASIVLYFMPIESLPEAVRGIHQYFGTEKAVFIWSVAAIVLLPFFKGRR